jgi:hypothetical protein
LLAHDWSLTLHQLHRFEANDDLGRQDAKDAKKHL